MRVLLIEDEARTAESVRLMLTSLGHDCDWAEDGESGAARALSREHDVILLDIMLPGIDGYDVLQQIRSAEVNTPVIMQSGLVERATAVKGLGLGAADYLIKPYGKEELAARMAAALERAQLRPGSTGRLADADTHPQEHQYREAPRVAGERGHRAPDGEPDRHHGAACSAIGPARERNAHHRVHDHEHRAGEQPHLLVGRGEVGLDLVQQHRDDVAIDEVERVHEHEDREQVRRRSADPASRSGVGRSRRGRGNAR